MSYLGGTHSVPKCYICDIFFKTKKEKREHDSVAHDRYQSTDNQQGSWIRYDQTDNKDYFICFIHAKKLNEDFRCPVKGCDTSVIGRKSLYLQELRSKVPEI